MKKQTLSLVIIVALVVVGVALIAGQRGNRRPLIISEGDRAPDFRLPSLDGTPVDLAAYRGKVVMLHFWATWCPPCVEEIPTIEKMYRKFMGTDFVLLAVSVDEGGAAAVGDFLRRNNLTLPVLLNPDRSVATSYGTLKFPETYLIDRQGVVRYKAIGARDWSYEGNIQIINALLARK